MADRLMAKLQAFGVAHVIEHGRCKEDELLTVVFEQFGDEIHVAWEQLAREAIRRKLKTAFKRLETDDDALIQTRLPGLDLPQVISVPRDGGGIEYVQTLVAAGEDANAQLLLRDMNIIRATRKRDEWRQVLDRLKPAWDINPDWTIGECIEHLAGQP